MCILSALLCLVPGHHHAGHEGNRAVWFSVFSFFVKFWGLEALRKCPLLFSLTNLTRRPSGPEANGTNLAVNESLSLVTTANKGFAFDLYRRLAAQADNQGKNVFFSPSSVSLALAALSAGARGRSHQQLFSALGFSGSQLTQADVDGAFHGLLAGASSEDVSAGTAVFVDEKFKPQPEFLQVSAVKKWFSNYFMSRTPK